MRVLSRRLWVPAVVMLLLPACVGPTDKPLPGDAQGPRGVRTEVVEKHAAQFDEELFERPAGSQQEFAAASYITGHLQQAGYEVRLASVPYKDLVRSTNVVALPPAGEPISAIVTVAYDTAASLQAHGRDIGLFLEVARALRVREPEHSVQFVALGAEVTAENGGNLGSKALAGELADLDEKPPVIALVEVAGGGFLARGPGGDDLNRIAAEMDMGPSGSPSDPLLPAYQRSSEIFLGVDAPHAVAAGGLEEVGRVVLGYLSGR